MVDFVVRKPREPDKIFVDPLIDGTDIGTFVKKETKKREAENIRPPLSRVKELFDTYISPYLEKAYDIVGNRPKDWG